MRTAFLSSTGADLRAHREAAFLAIQKLDGWKCIRMEDFGARDWDVDTFCREKVKECDLFVGIIGHRFGAGPKGSKESYTQREYQAAVDAKKPRLLFLAPEDFAIPNNLLEPMGKIKAQAKFRTRLSASGDRIVSMGFTSPDDLKTQIAIAIYNLDNNRSGDATRYLSALWEETAYIDIRGLRVGNESVYRFRIDQLYTPLSTVGGGAGLQPAQLVPLHQALQKRCIVLVGDPGAGKSTFLRRIAFAACETMLGRDPLAASDLIATKPCPLPLLIRAASLASHIHSRTKIDTDRPKWLVDYLETVAKESDWNLDAAYFRQQLESGCLLLFDGMDEIPNQVQRKAMSRLLDSAARTYTKTQFVVTSRPPAYGGETVIPGFDTIQIGPLEDSAVATFIANWCKAVEKPREHEEELLGAIRSRQEIQRMAVNPVMLTALAALHWNRKRLPDQRSELYESVLDWLATAREAKTSRPSVLCLGLMEHLAYAMHTAPKGKQVEISRDAAARILAPRFREIPADEQIAAAERFLEEEETDSGILVSRGNMLRYWHLTFQEYLTAKSLAWRDADRQRLLITEKKLYQPEWREAVLLLAGVLCKQDTERIDAFLKEVLDQLGEKPRLADRARCVGLIGLVLRDLKSWNYSIADKRYHENLDKVLAIFDVKEARKIDFQTRLEAADALGQAGDPRLDRDNWIPVKVAGFRIGRYPVTVYEYQQFVEAGGYEKEQFWKAGGFKAFPAPQDWEEQLRFPNRPVVSVSWYEAAAYCAWAGCRLPTEAEWELAAYRGREDAKYPWGNQKLDDYRGNYHIVGHPTPVGLYPSGATPSGIEDMFGNVLEWTTTDSAESKLLLGSSWRRGAWPRSTRLWGPLSNRYSDYGFRCVKDASL